MPLTNEFLSRSEEASDEKFGCRPYERPLKKLLSFGIINLDKPAGPTSHEVAAWVRDILKAKRAGHSGTLDPNVTGVLPTALDEATKVLYALLPAGKEYVGVMHLHKEISEEALRALAAEFVGTIMQKPPVRSAVKREIRPRKIYSLEILEISGHDVLFRTSVEAGTYIRKLCHDIGARIGGANMTQLRRTRAGPFLEKDSVTLQDLVDAIESGEESRIRKVILPVEAAVAHLPKIWVKDGAIEALCCGANLASVGVTKLDAGIVKGDLLAIMSGKDELVSLGEAVAEAAEIASAKKGWAAKPVRVVLPAGTYPRMWHKKAA
jgi:H/ACA ribonucleoprotein complex subunit 4